MHADERSVRTSPARHGPSRTRLHAGLPRSHPRGFRWRPRPARHVRPCAPCGAAALPGDRPRDTGRGLYRFSPALSCSHPWLHRHACLRTSPRCPAVWPHAFLRHRSRPAGACPISPRRGLPLKAPSVCSGTRDLRRLRRRPAARVVPFVLRLPRHPPADVRRRRTRPALAPDPLQLLRRDIRREPVHRSGRLPSTAAPSLTALAQRPRRPACPPRPPVAAVRRPPSGGSGLRPPPCPASSLLSLLLATLTALLSASFSPASASSTAPPTTAISGPHHIPPRSVAFRPPAPLPDRATTRPSFQSARPSYALGSCCQGPFPLPMLSLRCSFRPSQVRGSSSRAWSCPSASRVIAIWSSSGSGPRV